MQTLQSRLRTTDVARLCGYSVQQVRDLERDGVLPPVARTASGYRVFGERHVLSALAYRSLALATGPVEAKRLLRAVHERPTSVVLAELDAVHARLDLERHELRLAKEAAASTAVEPVEDPRPSDAMSVSELAAALGVRASTLRHWEAEGLLAADRSPTGTRRYTPAQVRDTRVVHQLRSAGYRIDTLRELMSRLPRGGTAEVEAALAARDRTITTRSRALLEASARLHTLLTGTA